MIILCVTETLYFCKNFGKLQAANKNLFFINYLKNLKDMFLCKVSKDTECFFFNLEQVKKGYSLYFFLNIVYFRKLRIFLVCTYKV